MKNKIKKLSKKQGEELMKDQKMKNGEKRK